MSREQQMRMGDLYEEVRFVLDSSPDAGTLRRELSRLSARYPDEDVNWIMGVIVVDNLRQLP